MWRFYAQRANSGLWLDTDVQLNDPTLRWSLSSPSAGSATYLKGVNPTGLAEDGQPLFGKWNTLLYAEEDGELSWFGVCSGATPTLIGQSLEFIGFMGWLSRVPYTGTYSQWKTNAFDVVRHIVRHGMLHKPSLPITYSNNDSLAYLGDAEPPNKPKQPSRRKGESKSEYTSSKRYRDWQKAVQNWTDRYGDREKYEISWFEAPYCGEEIDAVMKETGAEYRELVRWTNKGALRSELRLDLQDHMSNRRTDIQFVDGTNIAKALDPKDNDEAFANHVIALGAGEGRKMLRAEAGDDDGRLYQGEYVQYKHITKVASLRSLAQADHKRLSSKAPKIQQVVVRDVPGFSPIKSLRVGDEVRLVSKHTSPQIDVWTRLTGIERKPNVSTATITVEVAE